MTTVRILIAKELSNSFHAWGTYIGYIVFFGICGFCIWLSGNNIFYTGQASLLPVFHVINWTQFFMIPALTMKSIADEKRSGTLELILTQPVRVSELVDGKFFAYLLLASIALLLTLPYYITIASLGTVDHGTVFLGYLGLMAMAACNISIGLFASSLSYSPISAFFIHLGIGLSFQFLFGFLAGLFHNGFLNSLFNYLSLEEHFETLTRGILDSRSLVFFLAVCILFLSLSKLFIYKSRL